MGYGWMFKEAGPGDRARESQVEKFFNSDAVSNRANAIVREGIQNSLDAAPDDVVVRVRIAIGCWSADKSTDRLPTYTNAFYEHFNVDAVRSKIADAPIAGEPFRYLVFEDFGTSGLTGDSAQWWPDEHGQPNPFFNYFRAEGISDKHGGARGRHGVGRLVFMFASRVHAIFGLTRRDGNRSTEELLMGTAVLRNHWYGEKPFLPDGWFGLRDANDPRLTLPLAGDNAAFIEQFKQDFGLARQGEKGLSVIVPWLSGEVTVDEVRKAVVAGYFHPILRKKLIVEVVAEDGGIQVIDADSINSVIESLPPDVSRQLTPLVGLARAVLNQPKYIELAPPPSAPGATHWKPEVIDDSVQQAIHDQLEAGDAVAIRVPMRVRLKKDAEPQACHFDVFLQRDAALSDGQIVFIREGIIVTDVRPRRTSGIRALVVIDQGPLASFLGDSENPSHTEWQAEMVRDKYSFHRATIDYVVQSVPQMLAIISQQQKKPDASLLIDLFSLPADDGTKAKQKKQKKKEGGETDDDEFDIPKTLKRYAIDKRADGFVVRHGDPGAKRPPQLAIKVAYGVRRGSPFSKYNKADFRLGLGGIECTSSGCDIVDFDENWMVVTVNEDAFEVAVIGFDTSHRDLHVDVRVKGDDDAAAEEAVNATAPAEEEVAHAATV